MKNTIEYKDSTTSTSGCRIPSTTGFKTLWNIKPFKLLEYGRSYMNTNKFRTPDNLERIDKLAISRHKKAVEIKLGLRKEEKIEKVKIIYQSFPYKLLTSDVIEKPNMFLDNPLRIRKCITSWVYWTEEKEKLVKEFEKKLDEVDELKRKIFDK